LLAARAVTESELNGLLDAHDALVKAYVDSSLTFSEFVCAYGDFPHNYALDGHSGTMEERAVLRMFGKRRSVESTGALADHLHLNSSRVGDDPIAYMASGCTDRYEIREQCIPYRSGQVLVLLYLPDEMLDATRDWGDWRTRYRK
jgi:hypothetical protein